MKKLPTLVMSLLSALSVLNIALPACAQHANSNGGFYKYKPGELQKPEWRQYKGQIQIIDDTPEVKDFRKPKDQGPTYQIEIPPIQNQQGGDFGINGGSNGMGGSPIIKLRPTNDKRLLAPGGTESNMNSLRAPSGNLPSGTSTGIHSSMQAPQGKPSALTPKSGKRELLNRAGSPKVQNNSVPSKYKEYEKINASGAGSNSSSTSLKGEMKNGGRGSLLKNTK
ncbi:hypothetical protein KA183_17070 [bacterium]|nr:hypothetical protein [bacterium]